MNRPISESQNQRIQPQQQHQHPKEPQNIMSSSTEFSLSQSPSPPSSRSSSPYSSPSSTRSPSPSPSASAAYINLICSAEGAIATDIKDLRARVTHMEPTLNYAVACAGYDEARRLLVVELQRSIDGIREQIDRLARRLADEKKRRREMRKSEVRKPTKPTRRLAQQGVSKGTAVPRHSTTRKLILHVRKPVKMQLQEARRNVTRLQDLIDHLPSINDVREPQLHGDVHESTVELVRARWEYLKTGSFGGRKN